MILVDYKSTTLRTNPSISVARKVLTILQHHYVETLGRALVVNLPAILSFFYKGIAPFLDPITREKMRFNPDLFELVPREQLDADFGGDYEFEFNHEAYWSQLLKYVTRIVIASTCRLFSFARGEPCGAPARYYNALTPAYRKSKSIGHVASRPTAHAWQNCKIHKPCR